MIRRLEIRGLVVIDQAELEPAAGLTAITGETGAGKTVVAQAVSLLVGGPTDAKAVRPGAGHALVQATLALPADFWDFDDDDPALAVRDLVDDVSEVVVAQRVPAEGRSRALIDGQTVTRASASAIAGRMMRFSSQHEGRKLVTGATQLSVLDGFAGAHVVAMATELGTVRRRLRGLQRQMDAARERREAADRQRAALEELVEALDAAQLDPAEHVTLRTDRDRLLHADRLASAVLEAAEAIAPESGDGGARDGSGAALHSLDGVLDVDASLRPIRETLHTAETILQEVASELRAYLASLDAEPGRLQQIEDRLATYDRLMRRYGPGLDRVLAEGDAARASLADLASGYDADEALIAEHEELLMRGRELASVLHEARAEAAPRLEQAVVAELADLAMEAATVRLELVMDESDPPIERAVVWLRANPGLPEAPLADVASGGELSRVLLALHGVAADADASATWIFDEVDAGVGGVTATAVAAKLRALAQKHQVIVITHLPQVAAVADRHYRLVKGVDGDGRATTTITHVAGDELVDELCRMLGSSPDDDGARRHANELLARRDATPTTAKKRPRSGAKPRRAG